MTSGNNGDSIGMIIVKLIGSFIFSVVILGISLIILGILSITTMNPFLAIITLLGVAGSTILTLILTVIIFFIWLK